MTPALLLASTSRYRQEFLARLGVPFLSAAPVCDEDSYKARKLTPQALAEILALAKAQSLRDSYPNHAIIGADQVAAVTHQDGWTILDKPGSAERALEQLRALAGRTHVLITAMVVISAGVVHHHTDTTTLRMRSLSEQQLRRYISADQPLDCCGAYKLEKNGIALFEAIESHDHSAITGLPLIALTRILTEIGFVIP